MCNVKINPTFACLFRSLQLSCFGSIILFYCDFISFSLLPSGPCFRFYTIWPVHRIEYCDRGPVLGVFFSGEIIWNLPWRILVGNVENRKSLLKISMIVFPLRSWARNTQGLKKDQSFKNFSLRIPILLLPAKEKETQSHVSSRTSVLPQKAQNEVQLPLAFFSLSLVSCLLWKGEESLVWFTHCNKKLWFVYHYFFILPALAFHHLSEKKKKSTLFLNFLFMKILWAPTQISFPSKAYSTVIAILVDCSLSFLEIIEPTYFGDCLKPSFQTSPPPGRIIIMTSLFFSPNTLMIITYYPPFHRTRFGGLWEDKYFLYS